MIVYWDLKLVVRVESWKLSLFFPTRVILSTLLVAKNKTHKFIMFLRNALSSNIFFSPEDKARRDLPKSKHRSKNPFFCGHLRLNLSKSDDKSKKITSGSLFNNTVKEKDVFSGESFDLWKSKNHKHRRGPRRDKYLDLITYSSWDKIWSGKIDIFHFKIQRWFSKYRWL